ncbi:PBP1A family penicillin-binding protein [Synechococcus sp. CBW1107]|uniref:transglycosylase domain-containing protein n=1 Tax=Synechococcus sp. CBW1107 TaxID=2789857 RepID=UPI002AD53C92|nr:PBP1A family penicillin-binding protein [Synechococcus sp. CBW1107]CAK6699504.1 Biosynthetic peptidoglycan transglycosylase [Synechococcus sp. CBW1107]
MSKRRLRLLLVVAFAAAAGGATALGVNTLVKAVDSLLPDARRISTFNRPGTVTILSADGEVLQKLGPATRDKVASGQMPELVKEAFIAAEDRRFYQHGGVDPTGIARAMVRNLSRGSVEEGASTITQQLARTVFLSQDRTLIRKLKEAALAGKLERQLSKQQILEQYLNYVYLGSSAYGVADAAWIYFSKTPDQLTLPEAALIAGLPPAPSVYSPLVNPELALQRRSVVLERMAQAGFIDAGELADAKASPLQLKPALPKYWNSRAPFFTGWVAQELPKVLSAEQLEVGGLTIRSSLNLAWQEEGQKVIDASAYGGMEGALVTVEPGTGLVRAMVGGKDFNKSQFNRATQALRSPGSTFKLFVYLSALKAGMKPEDTVVDAKRCFAGYCPKNFGDRYLGRVSLATALQNSLNTVAVSLLQQVGFDKVIATAQSLGITRELGRFYPMALGAYEQTVLDMTTAYAAVINRGVFVAATPFEEINGPNGELLWSRRVDGDKGRRAVDSTIADAMVWMLQRVVSGGTGGAASLPGRPVAGKTGTSEGARDLWFIGGIPQLTTGIWLGYDNNRKTGSDSGSAAAAWGRYMAVVVKDLPVRQFPPKPVLTGTFKPTKAAKSTFQPGRPSNLPTPGEDRDRPKPSQAPPPSEPGSDLPPLPELPEAPAPSLPPRGSGAGRDSAPGPEPTPARPAPRRPAAPQPAPVAPPPVTPSFPVAPPPVAPPPVAPPPVAPPPAP